MGAIDEFLSAPASTGNAIDDFLGPPPKSSALRRVVGDSAVALGRGVIGVPEAAVGIADIASGGRVGKAAENVGIKFKEAKDILGDYYSPEAKEANKAVSDAQGFFPAVGAAITHPSSIVNSAIESAPSFIIGGGVARGALKLAPKIGEIAAGALGEGAVAAGQNAEQVRQEDPNGTLTGEQSGILAASGLATGAIGLGAGKVANKLGLGDISTMVAGGKLGPVGEQAIEAGAKKGIARKIAEGALTEGALQELPQSYEEQVAQNIAQGKPWDEGAASAAAQGMLAGGLMGGAAAPIHGQHAAPVEAPPPAPGNPIRDLKVEGGGPLSRGVNSLVENEATAADAGKPVETPVAAALAGVPNEDAQHPDTPTDSDIETKLDESRAKAKDDAVLRAGELHQPGDTTNPVNGERVPAGPTFDPETGEIKAPQRAEFESADDVTRHLSQQRVSGGARTGKAIPVELEGGKFSFVREGEPGFIEAERKAAEDAAAEKAKEKGEEKPLIGLAKRRALAAKEKAKPAAAPAPKAEPAPKKTEPVASMTPVGRAPSSTAIRAALDDIGTRDAQTRAMGVPKSLKERRDAAKATAALAGKAIDGDWTAFSKESGTKGIPRADMPQIKAIHRGALTNFLTARGITHESVEIPAGALKPTQAEFSPAKVKKATSYIGEDHSILVSSDGHVLDGHHQWLAKHAAGQPIKAIQLNAPIEKLVAEVKEFPSSTQAAGATDVTKETDAKSSAQTNDTKPDVQHVDRDQEALQRSEVGRLPTVRSDGDQGVPAVGEQLRAVPSGHGAEAVNESHAGSGEESPRLPAGELPVGDSSGTDAKQVNESAPDVQRSDSSGEGLGKGDGAQPAGVVRTAEKGVDSGKGAVGTATSTSTESDEGVAPKSPKPKRQSLAARAAEAAEQQRAKYFTPGNIIRGYGGFDEVISYTPSDANGRWSVRVHSVEKVDGNWVRIGKPQDARNHSTQPEERLIKNGPIARVTPAAAAAVPHSEPRADGKDFPNATARQEPPAEASKPGKIDDFGETLIGARKMYAQAYADSMKDAINLPIAENPLSKTWPAPDYAKLIELGTDPWSVGFVRAARDIVPTKPSSSWKLKGWAESVKVLRDFSNSLLDGSMSRAELEKAMKTLGGGSFRRSELGSVLDTIALYEAVGHENSLKGITLQSGSYNVYKGQTFSPPKTMWSVNQKAKATSYSNWGNDLATADTREGAIAAFKALMEKKGAETTSPDSKTVTFELYGRGGTIFIGKKIGTHVFEIQSGFKDTKSARAYVAEHQSELESKLAKFKEIPSERKESNSPRVGEDHRDGGDVTPEQFNEAFGFRGVQFGNYVEGTRRQADLNEAYDALMDLAGVLNLPAKALSLNGQLGLAFGARGKGGKRAPMAHYESGNVVINLTKESGAGSLAHEWFHGLDNYFSRMGGARVGFMTDKQATGPAIRPEIREAFNAIKRSIAMTGIAERSKELDKRRTKAYWSTDLEMSARAFESYIINKLEDQSKSNDYLANVVSPGAFAVENGYPYPTAGEMPAIRAGFDAFFNAVQTRTTDAGNTAMFKVSEGTQSVDTSLYAPPTQAHADLAAELQAGLAKSHPGYLFHAVAAGSEGATAGRDSVSGEGRATVAAVAKRLFGHEVVFVAFDGKPLFNGVMSPQIPNTLFINANAHRPLMAVLGHELLHQLRASNEGIYNDLTKRLAAVMKNEYTYREQLEARYARMGLSTDTVKFGEELTADIVGDNFMDPEFWQAMGKDQPGLFRRIANTVIKFLDSAIAKMTGERPFGTQQYLTDIKAARDAVASALREFSGAQVGALTGQTDALNFSLADSLDAGVNSVRDVNLPAGYKLGDLFNAVGSAGTLGWWHKTVGTPHNLAERFPVFKRVYDATQSFLNDVSYYATEAANLAPTILPKLESLKDLAKSPLSAADTKALSAPVFEGTLSWARDERGNAVKISELEEKAQAVSPQDKAREMLRRDLISENVLKMWQGLPIDQYEAAVNTRYQNQVLKAGVVWTDAELKSNFGLTDAQIPLYREFRSATDKSLTNLAISDMIRFGGKDVDAIRQKAIDTGDVNKAAEMLRDHLYRAGDVDAARKDVLNDTAEKMIEKAERASDLMKRGYAPLSRFGQYTLDVVAPDGTRNYFGMFESATERSKMQRQMAANFPDATITQGTVSQEAYKMFAGVSPETLELFGDMLGLEAQGDDAGSKAFQEYLKVAKSNRSAMKRLIERKGIAGFSEDAGRVLAGFVYSNARQNSSNLNMKEMTDATLAIPQQQGQLRDHASKMTDYVKNPQEEAQGLKGLLFAQYLGGSVASAMVNTLQPLQVTFPYLSQYGGALKAGKQMLAASRDALRRRTGDAALDAALHKAEEEGIVSPQEVFQLMGQAQGKGVLRSGDGTTAGNVAAKVSNFASKTVLAWGKVFGVAEQYNRRVAFIAAYRTAVAQGMPDPAKFAAHTVAETQFTYNKGNKPQWARGAVGGTLFTFKQFAINNVELMHRMWTRGGPAGKRAALLQLGVLFLMAGASGLPGSDDLDDLLDGVLQRMGYNFSSKDARKRFFAETLGLGDAGAQFMEKGLSGLPGSPIDVSGRLGLGNLIPGTGLATKKDDYGSDVAELLGPAGDLAKRAFKGAGQIAAGAVTGDIGGVAKGVVAMSPTAIQNAAKALDMANTGMYRDQNGKKVIDVSGYDAAAKAIGFQPNDVGRVQSADRQISNMVALNKLREKEISSQWAQAIFEKDQGGIEAARKALSTWNIENPESPIRITPNQIRSQVQSMSLSKDQRLMKTAPREIRGEVARRLQASTQ